MPRFSRKWNDAEIKTLVEMWPTGMRAALIGHMIGKTKNAVIGQAHRMKLPKRDQHPGPRKQPIDKRRQTPEERAAKARERMRRFREQPRTKAVRKPRIDYSSVPPPEALMLSIMELESRHCRFPIGDPKEAGFGFCGAPREDGKSYCAHHCRLAYVPDSAARRRSEQTNYRIKAPPLSMEEA